MFNSDEFERDFEQSRKRFNLTFNITWIAIILFVVIGGFMAQYNSLVDKNARVEQYYSVIETTLQRRNDLIPNVVNSVKGYMAHEEKFLNIGTGCSIIMGTN